MAGAVPGAPQHPEVQGQREVRARVPARGGTPVRIPSRQIARPAGS